jgi:hypothetical protein
LADGCSCDGFGPAGSLPLAGRGHLCPRSVEEVEGEPAQDGEVLRAVVAAFAGAVLVESDVDGPEQPVLNCSADARGRARTTDPDERLYRKGDGGRTKLCCTGHALMENRNGLIVGAATTRVTGGAEPLAAIELVRTTVNPGARP